MRTSGVCCSSSTLSCQATPLFSAFFTTVVFAKVFRALANGGMRKAALMSKDKKFEPARGLICFRTAGHVVVLQPGCIFNTSIPPVQPRQIYGNWLETTNRCLKS